MMPPLCTNFILLNMNKIFGYFYTLWNIIWTTYNVWYKLLPPAKVVILLKVCSISLFDVTCSIKWRNIIISWAVKTQLLVSNIISNNNSDIETYLSCLSNKASPKLPLLEMMSCLTQEDSDGCSQANSCPKQPGYVTSHIPWMHGFESGPLKSSWCFSFDCNWCSWSSSYVQLSVYSFDFNRCSWSSSYFQ